MSRLANPALCLRFPFYFYLINFLSVRLNIPPQNLLPNNMNVFATTASNATTSSFACYFDEKRRTFLADVYSIKVDLFLEQ